MKKILSYMCILISLAVATDHAPLNISPRLELIGQTTYCRQSVDDDNFKHWLCIDFEANKYCDVPKSYYVEYSDEYGWEISYPVGYKTRCKLIDTLNWIDTTDRVNVTYWEYRISNDNVISEYSWHIDGNDRVLDDWRKGKIDENRKTHQILAFRKFVLNGWFKKGYSH